MDSASHDTLEHGSLSYSAQIIINLLVHPFQQRQRKQSPQSETVPEANAWQTQTSSDIATIVRYCASSMSFAVQPLYDCIYDPSQDHVTSYQLL